MSARPNSILPPISADTFKRRAERVREAMRHKGFDALVVWSSPTLHGTGTSTSGYVRYLTGLTDISHPLMLVLPVSEEPALVCPSSYTALARERKRLWFADARVGKPSSYGEMARGVLAERCGPRARVGIVGAAEITSSVYAELSADSPLPLEEATWLIGRERMVKGPEEIERHRIAAELCDAMFEAGVESARASSRRVWQVMVDMECAARARAAEYARAWIATQGTDADTPVMFLSDGSKELDTGDHLFLGDYTVVDGYWGHAIRAGSKGKPSEGFLRAYEILIEVQEAGIAMLRPGVPMGDLHREMVRVFKRHFPNKDYFGRTGHGLGLEYSDPVVSDFFPHSDYDQPFNSTAETTEPTFEPGMVVEIHPVFLLPELGCPFAQVGDMCLVTSTGAEVLTRFPREAFAV